MQNPEIDQETPRAIRAIIWNIAKMCFSGGVLAVIGFISLAAGVWLAYSDKSFEAKFGYLEDKESLVILDGSVRNQAPNTQAIQSIQLHQGDVLQITPFRYPVIPRIVGYRLETTFDEKGPGNNPLTPIGEIPAAWTSEQEGSSGRTVFLYAHSEGQTTVWFAIRDTSGQFVENYSATYLVQVKPKH